MRSWLPPWCAASSVSAVSPPRPSLSKASSSSKLRRLWAAPPSRPRHRLRSFALALATLASLALLSALLLLLETRWARSRAAAAAAAAAAAPPRPAVALPLLPLPLPRLRIPRLLHVTHPIGSPPSPAVSAALGSWEALNPGWEVRRYSDAARDAFVAAEFPQYFAVFAALPEPAARGDLFRLLVLLRRGGVYADADARCVRPLEQLLRPEDTLVAGWENSFESRREAASRAYVRTRQVLNWAIAAAPGHPALAAAAEEAVARARQLPAQLAAARAARDAAGYNRAVLEATGPGVLTDALLRWYASHAAAAAPPQPPPPPDAAWWEAEVGEADEAEEAGIAAEAAAAAAAAAAAGGAAPRAADAAGEAGEAAGEEGGWALGAGGGGGCAADAAAWDGSAGAGDPFWSLRLLPRAAWGTHPRPGSSDGVPQTAPEVAVAHAFEGSWKRRRGVEALRWPLRPLLRPLARALAGGGGASEAAVAAVAGGAAWLPGDVPAYPLSVSAWEPPFDVLLLPPAEEAGAGALGRVARTHAVASASLFAWGAPPPRVACSPADALLRSLHAQRAAAAPPPPAARARLALSEPAGPPGAGAGEAGGPGATVTNGLMFIDVGSGLGYYSLAAAAAGYAVLAFEPDGALRTLHAAASRANAARARGQLLQLSGAPLGAPDAPAFADAWLGRGGGGWPSEAAEAAAGGRAWRASLAEVQSLDDALAAAGREAAAGGGNGNGSLGDAWWGRLGGAGAAEAPPPPVHAVRLAARGWEGWILSGSPRLFGGPEPPAELLVELQPRRLQASGWGDAAKLWELMAGRGYASALHAGPACEAAEAEAAAAQAAQPPLTRLSRWLRLEDGAAAAAASGAAPPPGAPGGWCHLGRAEALALARAGAQPASGPEPPSEALLFSRPAALRRGFKLLTLRAGYGQQPLRGQSVSLRCRGYGKSGDLSAPFWPGDQPFDFRVGMGLVIKAWDEAVLLMRVGETARVTASADYACVLRRAGARARARAHSPAQTGMVRKAFLPGECSRGACCCSTLSSCQRCEILVASL